MPNEYLAIPLSRLIIVFGVLFLLGNLLTLPLYKFDWPRFRHSTLFKKIVLWIPIFGVFLAAMYGGTVLRLLILGLLIVAVEIELLLRGLSMSKAARVFYGVFMTIALLHFWAIGFFFSALFTGLLTTICFASVLSDVFAFFFGNYFGRHKLPHAINEQKSWEGVAGQLLGALVGMLVVNAFISPVISMYIFLPIGIGSAFGDLLNSYMKRLASVKDWSNAIPGHGGYTDRLSSLASSSMLVFYFLVLMYA